MSKISNNKIGVSLIVLIITIIIIIIIASSVILTLGNSDLINNARKASFINDISNFQEELEMYKITQYSKSNGKFSSTSLNVYNEEDLCDILNSLKNKSEYVKNLKIIKGKLVYDNVSDLKKQEWAEEINITVVKEIYGINKPVLIQGMTPIKWDAGGNLLSTTVDDIQWYDYSNKKWANAITEDGSMWVWIPRYEYKIPIVNFHSSTAGTIDINFIRSTTVNPTDNDFIVHPAFKFGNLELSGIWVAKFEATASEGVANTEIADNVITKTVKIIPNVQSWRYINISNMFDVCRKMENNEIYGWGTNGKGIDTHLMKNIEWGACVYLANSIYGQNSEIWINPNNNYLTGQAGSSINNSSTSTTNQYNNLTYGVNASTSGTVYGIYDMRGGSYERVSAYVDNGRSSLINNGQSLLNAEEKYKDLYIPSVGETQQGNYLNSIDKKGDAIYETSNSYTGSNSWYLKYSYMSYLTYNFIERGGYRSLTNGSGMFFFNGSEGAASASDTFRPTLMVDETL